MAAYGLENGEGAMRRVLVAVCVLLAWPAAAQQKNDVVSVGQTLSLAQAPYYIALEKDYFGAEHITVENDSQRGAQDTVAMLATGKLDVSIGAISAGLYNAEHQGLDIRIVAAMGVQPGPAVATPSVARKDLWDSGAIKSGKDFMGRKIAVNVPGAIPEYFLYLILEKYGMTMKDVDETILGFPQMLIAFANKGIDVGILPEPFATTAVSQGSGVVIPSEEGVGVGELTTMVFFSGEFLRGRPEVGVRFLRALLRAAHETQGAYAKDPALSGILAKATKLKPESVRDSVAAAFDRDLDIDKFAASLSRQERVYMKLGRLAYDTPLDLSKVIDAALVHRAAGSLK
jgi:NitT/TauT family transport system substrate-binding protein